MRTLWAESGPHKKPPGLPAGLGRFTSSRVAHSTASLRAGWGHPPPYPHSGHEETEVPPMPPTPKLPRATGTSVLGYARECPRPPESAREGPPTPVYPGRAHPPTGRSHQATPPLSQHMAYQKPHTAVGLRVRRHHRPTAGTIARRVWPPTVFISSPVVDEGSRRSFRS